MKKILTQIIVTTTLIAASFAPLHAKDVATPYEHIPVDTFIGGFPSEAFIMIGLIAYFVGTTYIFNSALLRQTIK